MTFSRTQGNLSGTNGCPTGPRVGQGDPDAVGQLAQRVGKRVTADSPARPFARTNSDATGSIRLTLRSGKQKSQQTISKHLAYLENAGLIEIDLRVGGAWRYVWRSEEKSREFGMHGEYREIRRPERIVHTEISEESNSLVTGRARALR